MKSTLKYFIPVAAFIFLYACKKNDGVTNQAYSAYGAPQGLLKVNLAFTYTVDYSTILVKLNGQTVSNSLQTRTPYPGGGFNTRGSNFAVYLNAPTGNNTVSIVLPKVGTTTDSIVLFSKTDVNIAEAAKPYTLHVTDTATNVKSVLVQNIITNVDTGFCRFRFINLIPNQPAVDVYLNGVLIKSNMAYLTPSDTFSVRTGVNAPGYTSGSTPTWAIRPAGAAASTTPIASYASASILASQSVLTMYSMGYAGATGTRLPFLCFTLDKNR